MSGRSNGADHRVYDSCNFSHGQGRFRVSPRVGCIGSCPDTHCPRSNDGQMIEAVGRWVTAAGGSAKTAVRATPRTTSTSAARECSAGTFANRKDADKAWQTIEANFAAGRPTDPRRGRMTFRTYVDDIWFPNHVIEPSTRQSYRYNIDKHLMPTFGPMRMSTIMPMHVREWVTVDVERRRLPRHDPAREDHPVVHLHHRADRPHRDAAPVQGREVPDRPGEGVPHPHPGGVRRPAPGAAVRRAAARRDG